MTFSGTLEIAVASLKEQYHLLGVDATAIRKGEYGVVPAEQSSVLVYAEPRSARRGESLDLQHRLMAIQVMCGESKGDEPATTAFERADIALSILHNRLGNLIKDFKIEYDSQVGAVHYVALELMVRYAGAKL